MSSYTPQENKPGAFDAKPARVVLRDGQIIKATHHFRTENNKLVCLYTGPREAGIDYQIPRESVMYIDTTGHIEELHTDADADARETMAKQERRHGTRDADMDGGMVAHTPHDADREVNR